MDLIERLQDLGTRALKLKDQVHTEEATKTAFIMPFLSALGYDVFNPTEVQPEFIADLGMKKGEKVDYCIFLEGKPAIIIEAKHWSETLDVHKSQLHRYFHVTPARFGILTNGILYRIYTDLVESNKMDDRPFFEFSMDAVTEQVTTELKKFQKSQFDPETIYETASDLRYSKEIKELLANEYRNPSDDFVYYFASKIYQGKVTSKVREQFAPLVSKSFKDHVNDLISNRLQSALNNEEQVQTEKTEKIEEVRVEEANNGIVTTEDEIQGFRIISAILSRKIEPDRLAHRDTKSYIGILLDDNNRKPICRLYLNGTERWYVGTFDSEKNEEKHLIENLRDLYKFEQQLLATVDFYDA